MKQALNSSHYTIKALKMKKYTKIVKIASKNT